MLMFADFLVHLQCHQVTHWFQQWGINPNTGSCSDAPMHLFRSIDFVLNCFPHSLSSPQHSPVGHHDWSHLQNVSATNAKFRFVLVPERELLGVGGVRCLSGRTISKPVCIEDRYGSEDRQGKQVTVTREARETPGDLGSYWERRAGRGESGF